MAAKRNCVVLQVEVAELTAPGLLFVEAFGLAIDAGDKSRRPLCRTCLDWSERRPHLAGRLGAALATRMLERTWLERAQAGRALTVTATGVRGLRDTFAIAWER